MPPGWATIPADAGTAWTGARPTKDGLSATAFPSGVKSVPVEIVESIAPVVIWREEYRVG